jgi:hypothetical protein
VARCGENGGKGLKGVGRNNGGGGLELHTVVFPGNEADIYRYWDDKGVRKVRNYGKWEAWRECPERKIIRLRSVTGLVDE